MTQKSATVFRASLAVLVLGRALGQLVLEQVERILKQSKTCKSRSNSVSESINFKERVILAGDANINMDEVTKIGQNSTLVVENLKQITEKSGYQQLVTEVTREGTVKCKARNSEAKYK